MEVLSCAGDRLTDGIDRHILGNVLSTFPAYLAVGYDEPHVERECPAGSLPLQMTHQPTAVSHDAERARIRKMSGVDHPGACFSDVPRCSTYFSAGRE